MSMGKLEFELEVRCSADKFWGEGIKNTTVLLPKIYPNRFKSIEVVEGAGFNVGTVRLVKYTEDTRGVTFGKEKVELLDDVNKILGFSVIDEELKQLYKSLKGKIEVVPKGEGSLVKWSLEIEKTSDEVLDPVLMQVYTEKSFIALDDYLLKN